MNKLNLILLIIYSSILLSSCYAQIQGKIQTIDTVMKTDISGGYLMQIDFDALHIKGDKSMMFFDKKGLIIGLNDEPYMLVAGTDFELNNLPDKIAKKLSHTKIVILRPPILLGDEQPEQYYLIPIWLRELNAVESLRMNHIEIDDLRFLQNTPIKHLIIHDANVKDKKKLAGDISKLKHLQYLAYDFIFSTQEITKIQLSLPNAVILSVSEFNKDFDSGKIVFPQ